MKARSSNLFLQAFSDKKNLLLALKMSLIVGTILNCINQGECFVNQNFDQLHMPKFLITYTVPFFVSIYSSTVAKLNK